MGFFIVVQEFYLHHTSGEIKSFKINHLYRSDDLEGYNWGGFSNVGKVQYLKSSGNVRDITTISDLVVPLLTRDRCTTFATSTPTTEGIG